jgi:hypothetical protein
MGTFQSEFPNLDATEKDRFHKELWALYSARVAELVRGGTNHVEAERQAIGDTKVAFIERHPDLAIGNWRIRVVQP